jgi:protein gp37
MKKQNKSTVKNRCIHKIGWLNLPGYKGETWNPIIGCSKVSEGCKNCYAEQMAGRLAHMPKSYKYSNVVSINPSRWNGKTEFVDKALKKPLHWKKPRIIFVCSMGDLFHESVPFEWIDKVMAVAALIPQHIFIVLTKRARRIAEYFGQGKKNLVKNWVNASYEMGIADKNDDDDFVSGYITHRCNSEHNKTESWGWPLDNIWLGVTAENQATANERIPYLLKTPATVRFVSVEPMLGLVDLKRIPEQYWGSEYNKEFEGINLGTLSEGKKTKTPWHLDWVICGGESGHQARPMHPDWARSLRDQCKNNSVPFYFKQWGEWLPNNEHAETLGKIKISREVSYGYTSQTMLKVGRKAAGSLLDGKKHEEYPKINL